MDYDVAVVGLGIMGAGAAWRLASRGARVVGFEQFQPGHDRGSSHGESRIFRTAYFEEARYVPLLQESYQLWRTLESGSGRRLLEMTGRLEIGTRESNTVKGALQSAAAHDLPIQLLDSEEMRTRYPQHHLEPEEVATYEEQGGVLYAEPCIEAMLSRAKDLEPRT